MPSRSSKSLQGESSVGSMTVMTMLISAYLVIGAVIGLVHEERFYRRSSRASRATIDYAFSACMGAILWPIGFVVAQEGRE